MTTASQSTQTQSAAKAPMKSVWKKWGESTAPTFAQPAVNGTSDDAHERDSVSSKDLGHGEGSSQGHTTPASSMTDEVQIGSPPPLPPAHPHRPSKDTTTDENNSKWQTVPSSTNTDIATVQPNSSATNQKTLKDSDLSQSRNATQRSASLNSDASPHPTQPPSTGSRTPKQLPIGDISSQGRSTPASSQGASTPASSVIEESQSNAPTLPPVPSFRPAPLPAVNPWKQRQEAAERQRWKESQEVPIQPLVVERSVPKPPTTVPPKPTSTINKPNGVKQDGKAPSRRSTKNNIPTPPNLEDSEAWPSPDVAAIVEKEQKPVNLNIIKESKETVKEENIPEAMKETERPERKEPKEPREPKKKKWEKIEVNFQYDSPQSRRGRGGKVNRNGRGGGREGGGRGKDDRSEREDKSRGAQRSDGEESNYPNSKSPGPIERRTQSLSFEAGHRQPDMPPPNWTMHAAYSHEPLSMDADPRIRSSSPSRAGHSHPSRDDVSSHRERSPGSLRIRDSSSPNGSRSNDQYRSPILSPTGQPQFQDLSPPLEEQEHNSLNPNNGPPSNSTRRASSRGYRGRSGPSPNAFQPHYPPPQIPNFPYYPQFYPAPMPFIPGRSHSVPYYQPNAASRYPPTAYSHWIPDYSRLGVQPVPMIDEDIKHRIIRQVEYYFSSENLYKDEFLRKKMDSQGYVPLHVLVTFHRLHDITNDVPTVLNALLASTEVEVLANSDRGPLVRARHDPMKWIYPMNERDEIGKHDGPSAQWIQNQHNMFSQMPDMSQYQYAQPYFFDGQYSFPPGPYRPPENALPAVNEPDPHSSVSPVGSPQFDSQDRKLSGDASVFIPNGVNYGPPMMNGETTGYSSQIPTNSIPEVTAEMEDPVEVFDEDRLRTVRVTVTEPKDKPIVPALPMNGINHKADREKDVLRTPTSSVTWHLSDASTSTSPLMPSGEFKSKTHETSPQRTRETPVSDKVPKRQVSQSGSTEFSYAELRSRALQSRQTYPKSSKDSTQMINLYRFWSDFLSQHWAPSMYSEFVKYAVEDANQGRRFGLLKLFSTLTRILESTCRISLWDDFVRLAGEDYRNGHLAGIENVWRIWGHLSSKGKSIIIKDGDVSRLIEAEIRQSSDLDRLRREIKPASVVLVPYTTVQ